MIGLGLNIWQGTWDTVTAFGSVGVEWDGGTTVWDSGTEVWFE